MSTPMAALTEAAARVAMFTTAVQLGLLDAIDREPSTVDDLARRCGANERGVRLLLAALVADGFVEEVPGGRFQPTAPGLASLHPLLPIWDQLPEAVRTGKPALDMDSPDTATEMYPHVVASLANMWRDAAVRTAELLPAATRILDVGAGAAPWSIAIAKQNKHSRVVALDLPPVLSTTKRAVAAAADVADQFAYLAGDVFSMPLPVDTYDLVIVGQLCHLFDEPTCVRLIDRLVGALRPGGTLALLETLAGGRGAAVHELSLYLRTRGGALYSPETYQKWLRRAGLDAADVVEVNGTPAIGLFTGRRPSA
ncbi:methyltransferase [Fodinicola acaciae]|uniref:methyltransferase n=1 Tax=Fodinicola acaciae TaxID=2681555 RepID=UPI0013CF6AD3|nr:class I SAM-dependent methyltransferase [Fodinicola acaciae]